MIRRLILAIALATSWPAVALADMIDTSGMQPWETCALCHGLDGISRMPKFPRLAGQPERYLVKQLEDFRAMRRRNDDSVMADNASLLAPAEIAVVARHFSSQSAPEPIDPAAEQDMAAGARIFRQGDPARELPACASCHVNGADPDRYPQITAQHPDYIAKQLRDFRAASRTNDPDGIMRSVAAKLADHEIESVAVYAASQPRQQRRKP
ncbi:MAG: cytochrome C [Proteobacteria bacterium]|nr:cytochrome C [Pseudomonadota bacterium]